MQRQILNIMSQQILITQHLKLFKLYPGINGVNIKVNTH